MSDSSSAKKYLDLETQSLLVGATGLLLGRFLQKSSKWTLLENGTVQQTAFVWLGIGDPGRQVVASSGSSIACSYLELLKRRGDGAIRGAEKESVGDRSETGATVPVRR